MLLPLTVPAKKRAALLLPLGAFLFLLLAPLTLHAAPMLLAVSRPQVDGSGTFLDQLFDRDSAAPLPHLRVADAPALGQTLPLTRAQLATFLAAHQRLLPTTNFASPAQVHVSRRTRSLAETELLPVLISALQQTYPQTRGEFELRLTRPWLPILVPDEWLSARIYDFPSALSSTFMLRFELSTPHERLGVWQLSAEAALWREVPVARSPLRRGQLLRDAEIALERRDILSLRDPLPASILEDAFVELTENVSAGGVLLARSVRLRPVVRRGHLVEAILEEGGLNISLKVQVLEDGLPGQTIRVRNPKSKREFNAKVQNENTVLVSL